MTDDQGYVNQGTDPRVLGRWGGWLQSRLSFRSSTEPLHVMVCFPPYVSVAVPLFNGKYFTLRAGWRYDKNWPGYIADVIIKVMDHVVPY